MTMFNFETQAPAAAQFGLMWAAMNPLAITAAAGPLIMIPGGAASLALRTAVLPAPAALGAWIAPRAVTISRLSVRQRETGGAATNMTYAIYVNGVVTVQTITVAGNVVTVTTTGGASIAVPAGGRVELLVTAAADFADPPADIQAFADLV